jgi:hypothetical protein
MKSALFPFLLAAVVTTLVGIGVWMEPYFAGDVAATRAWQSAAPNPGWWARPISNLAPAPAKYYVMVVTAVLAYVVAGWRGLALIAALIAIEQFGADSTKALFKRPRPSRELIATASGSGYGFPSTTMTFSASPSARWPCSRRFGASRRPAGRCWLRGRSCSHSAAPLAWRSARTGQATSS